MKKKFIKILILLNAFLIPFYSIGAQDKGEIIPALNSAGITVEEINVNAHVNIQNIFFSPDEAKRKAIEMSKQLEVEDYSVEDYSTKDNTQLILIGTIKENEKVTIIVQATDIPDMTETNMVLDILSQNPLQELTTLEEKARDLLKIHGKVNLNSNIIGSHHGKLTVAEEEEIINQLLDKLDAKEVERYVDDRMVSITGYSSLIKNWMQYGDKKVNLNIAMRYNSHEEKTNLWLGTPFITVGY